MTLWAKIKAAILPSRDQSRDLDYGPRLLVSEPLLTMSPAVLQELTERPGTTELNLGLQPKRVVPLVLLRDYGTGMKYISSDGRFVALLMVEEKHDFTVRDAYSSLLIASFYQQIETFKRCLPSRNSEVRDCGQCAGKGIDPTSDAIAEILADRLVLVCQECAGLGWKTVPDTLDRRLALCDPRLLPDHWGTA